MKFRRALLSLELDGDARPAVSELRRVAPALARVLVVARLPTPSFSSLFGGGSTQPEAAALEAVERLRDQVRAAAPDIDVQLAPEVDASALLELAIVADIDLLVAGSPSLRNVSVLGEVHRRLGLPVLWPVPGASAGAIEHVGCVALGRRAQASIAAFLRDHADPSLRVTVLSSVLPASDELALLLDVAGIRATVDIRAAGFASMRSWIEEDRPGRAIELLVLTRIPFALLLGLPWPASVLLLPLPSAPKSGGPRALDVPDGVVDRDAIRLRVDYAALVGSLSPAAEQTVAFMSGGRVLRTETTTASGEVELPADLEATSLGVLRVEDDVLSAFEQRIAVLRPGGPPLLLFDAELPDPALRSVAGAAEAFAAQPLAVRLRPTRTARVLRERLRAVNLPAQVVDARAVLAEGDALDVAEANDPVRLNRVARRLLCAGFHVAAVFHRGLSAPEVPPSTRAESIPGNHIELEFDNATARRWLLEAIAESRESILFQTYMALDDDVSRRVEAALGEAGARGVAVRVLVDSLHGLHGSFGAENPLLVRLSARPGVELRAWRPLRELPSISDLKQRDHRKLAVVDDRIALIGGRNLGHEYYTAFEEARLSPETPWREVPWLDAGARISGPAVAAVAASFVEAWTEAGGAPFDIVPPPAAGAVTARVVVHRGLRDANTLDAHLEMIDGATSHIYWANGFPLILELQHALLRALRRGVRVRALTGHYPPTHSGRPFKGGRSSARATATEFVHSRLDALVEAGAEAYFFAKRDLPGWAPGLGVVHSNVHAKVLSVDGRACALGSANFDITSSYWESELILVVEDPALTRTLEAELEALLAEAVPWDKDDPAWQKAASRRAWMRRWPGILSL